MSVSLPVKIFNLDPVIGLDSTPFDFSAQVLLVPESPSGAGEMVSQALWIPQEIFVQGPNCLDIVLLLNHQQSTHSSPAPHGG